MGVIISCADKDILDVKNVTFGWLYERMLSIIDEENIVLSESLSALIEKLYTGQHGIGCDIAEYINTKEEFILFAYLVEQAIETINWTMPAAKEVVDHLWEFHAELLKYGEKLS